MKRIPLTQGKFALVDDDDYDRVMSHGGKWYAVQMGHCWYAMCRMPNSTKDGARALMHRVVLSGVEFVDHANRNGLDNRKTNLRQADRSKNAQNSKIRWDNKSGFKGVCWHKRSKKYMAAIKVNKKIVHLGCFDDPIIAAKRYDEAALIHYGEFARVNFP